MKRLRRAEPHVYLYLQIPIDLRARLQRVQERMNVIRGGPDNRLPLNIMLSVMLEDSVARLEKAAGIE